MKTDADGYIVDPESKAILNVDEQAWLKYKAQRDQIIKMNNIEQRLNALAAEVARLNKLIEEKNK